MSIIIGCTKLTREYFHSILIKKQSIALDGTLSKDFLKSESGESAINLDSEDVKKKIESYQEELSKQGDFRVFDHDSNFEVALGFFVLASVIQQRKLFNEAIAAGLVKIISAARSDRTLGSSPFALIKLISDNGARISIKEFAWLAAFIEQHYATAAAALQLFRLKDTLTMVVSSYALGLDAWNVSKSFIDELGDKHQVNKRVKQIARIVQNLTNGSKLSEGKGVQAWKEYLGILSEVEDQCVKALHHIIDNVSWDDEESRDTSIKTTVSSQLQVLLGSLRIPITNLNLITLTRLQETPLKGVKALVASFSDRNSQYAQSSISLASSNFGTEIRVLTQVGNWMQLLHDVAAVDLILSLHTLSERSKDIKQLFGAGNHKLFDLFHDNFAKEFAGSLDQDPATFQTHLRSFVASEFDAKVPNQIYKIEAAMEAKNVRTRLPKVPKGMRDFDPKQMAIRHRAFEIITEVFRQHGASELDTPVMELKETLEGKYGEEGSKLIYDVENQGGELLSLRYDLTVPFARYLAVNRLSKMKRYHIAKVYRRDQPSAGRGKFREFYQCDFDIAGEYDLMIPDAEVISVIHEILTRLDIGTFTIKVNHRKILEAIIELSGAPLQKFNAICSAIDKLDKQPWNEVRRELVEDKGLPMAVADAIGEFVNIRGPLAIIDKLLSEGKLEKCSTGKKALEDMVVLRRYIELLGVHKNVILDFSLARGLDYYTGMIMETVLEGAHVGSISGGGRYDNLVGMFSDRTIPATGASIGIERIFSILEKKYENDPTLRENCSEVFVATADDNLVDEKLQICGELWRQGIRAELHAKNNPKPSKQKEFAFKNKIPFIIWVRRDDHAKNRVRIEKTFSESGEAIIERSELVPYLRDQLTKNGSDLEKKQSS